MAAALKKLSLVSSFKKEGVSLRINFAKRKRSLLFGISRYLFGSHEENINLLTL